MAINWDALDKKYGKATEKASPKSNVTNVKSSINWDALDEKYGSKQVKYDSPIGPQLDNNLMRQKSKDLSNLKPFNSETVAKKIGLTPSTKFDYTPKLPSELDRLKTMGSQGINKLVEGVKEIVKNPSKLNQNGVKILKEGANRIANPTPKQKKQDIKELSTNPVAAFASKATDYATLGLSDKAIKSSPEGKKLVEDMQKNSPNASTIGALAGSIIPWSGAEAGIAKAGGKFLTKKVAEQTAKLALKDVAANLGKRAIIGGGAGAITMGTQTAIEGNKPQDILKSAALGTGMGVGGELVGAGLGKLGSIIFGKIKAKVPLTVAEEAHVKANPQAFKAAKDAVQVEKTIQLVRGKIAYGKVLTESERKVVLDNPYKFNYSDVKSIVNTHQNINDIPDFLLRPEERIIKQNALKVESDTITPPENINALKGNVEVPAANNVTENPTFKTYDDAQKAIDDYTDELSAKHGESEVLHTDPFKDSTTYGKNYITGEASKLSKPEVDKLASMYVSRDQFVIDEKKTSIDNITSKLDFNKYDSKNDWVTDGKGVENVIESLYSDNTGMYGQNYNKQYKTSEELKNAIYNKLIHTIPDFPDEYIGDYKAAKSIADNEGKGVSPFGKSLKPFVNQVDDIFDAITGDVQIKPQVIDTVAENAPTGFKGLEPGDPNYKPLNVETDKNNFDKARTWIDGHEQAAKDRIADYFKGTRLNSGLPVDLIADLTIVGASKIARGAVDIAEWSTLMVKEYGETIRPHLQEIYDKSKQTINEKMEQFAGNKDFPDTTKYISTKTVKGESGNIIKKAYESTIDDLYSIKGVNEESYMKALNTRQVDMIANRSLTTGLVDIKGNVVNESLKDITKEIPKNKELAFSDYMINRHAPSWLEQGRKVFPEEAGVTADVARFKAAKYETDNPEFKQLADRVIKYQQALTKTWLVDNGFMKAETWDTLVKKYPDYTPFQREFADIEKVGKSQSTKGGFVNQTNPIKKATGSIRKLIDPIDTIIERTGQYIKTVKRNDAMMPIVSELQKNPKAYEGVISIVEPKSATLSADALVDVNKILQEDGIDGLIAKFNEPWERQNFLANKGGAVEKGRNIVTVMQNGAPIHLKVNDMDFLKAISNLNPQQATAITRTVGKVTGMMKTLTTGINPVFGLARNIWRDLVTGYVNSKTINANPLRYAQYMWDLTRAVGNTIAEPLGRAEFLPKKLQTLFKKGGNPMAFFKDIGGGGHVSSISSDRNLLKKAKDSIMPKSLKQKVASVPGKILGGIESLNNTLEAAPRLAEAKRVLKKGGTTDEALFESQDLTVNFSKKGNVTKEFDAAVPYLNAAVQGLDKVARVYNPASSGWKNVANSVAKSVYAITIPTIILYAAVNHDDPDYNMLSDYQKDNYFNIPNGDGTFTKIPKPREQGVVFGSLIERTLRLFKDKDPEAFKRFGDTVKQNFMPPYKWIFTPLSETKLFDESNPGYDWRGNPIESQSMQNLSPKNRYDEKTSEPSKFIGGRFNLSPKKLDALAKSYLGGIAQMGLPALTKGKNIMDVLKAQITTDPAYSNDIMNDFYKELDKLQKKANDKDFESGTKGAADTKQKTVEELYVTQMNVFKKAIDTINNRIKETPDDTQKRNLRLGMLSVAKAAIKYSKQIP